MAHLGPPYDGQPIDGELDLLLDDLLKMLAQDEREVKGMSDELAKEMAEMTIGISEDEIAEIQQTVHMIRVFKAKLKEQVRLVKAEIRRAEFALEEAKYD